jgi:ketosteroid isomerase-like protein
VLDEHAVLLPPRAPAAHGGAAIRAFFAKMMPEAANDDTGKYLSVSKKKDGKWLYVRDAWNSDSPPPSREPAPALKK